MNRIIHKIKSIVNFPPNNTIGHWSLKEKKFDHCGDFICGKAEEYVKLAPKNQNN